MAGNEHVLLASLGVVCGGAATYLGAEVDACRTPPPESCCRPEARQCSDTSGRPGGASCHASGHEKKGRNVILSFRR
jgi:hypothetical protein